MVLSAATGLSVDNLLVKTTCTFSCGFEIYAVNVDAHIYAYGFTKFREDSIAVIVGDFGRALEGNLPWAGAAEKRRLIVVVVFVWHCDCELG